MNARTTRREVFVLRPDFVGVDDVDVAIGLRNEFGESVGEGTTVTGTSGPDPRVVVGEDSSSRCFDVVNATLEIQQAEVTPGLGGVRGADTRREATGSRRGRSGTRGSVSTEDRLGGTVEQRSRWGDAEGPTRSAETGLDGRLVGLPSGPGLVGRDEITVTGLAASGPRHEAVHGLLVVTTVEKPIGEL